MKRSLHEIETELKQARADALTAARAEKLNEFKQALDKRCFAYKHDGQGRYSRYIGLVRYSKLSIEDHRDDMAVKYMAERVYACFPPERKTRSYGQTCGVQRSVNEYDTATHLFDLTRQHIREVDHKLFKSVWDWPIMFAEKAWYAWPHNPDQTLDVVMEVNDEEHVLDCPYVTLTPTEFGFLQGSPFMLTNSRHLKTTNARLYVMAKIEEDTHRESRGAAFYEACDQRYLEQKASLRAELTLKFRSV